MNGWAYPFQLGLDSSLAACYKRLNLVANARSRTPPAPFEASDYEDIVVDGAISRESCAISNRVFHREQSRTKLFSARAAGRRDRWTTAIAPARVTSGFDLLVYA